MPARSIITPPPRQWSPDSVYNLGRGHLVCSRARGWEASSNNRAMADFVPGRQAPEMAGITQAGFSFLLPSRELTSHENRVRLHMRGTALFSV